MPRAQYAGYMSSIVVSVFDLLLFAIWSNSADDQTHQ